MKQKKKARGEVGRQRVKCSSKDWQEGRQSLRQTGRQPGKHDKTAGRETRKQETGWSTINTCPGTSTQFYRDRFTSEVSESTNTELHGSKLSQVTNL